MKAKGWLATAAVIAAAAVGGACASFGRAAFATPVVELKDVRLKGVGAMGGSLDVVLDVYNPNAYRLDARRVSYNLFVDSNRVATGSIEKLVTLGEHVKTEVVLPVSFTMQQMLGAAALLTRTGSIDYRVVGEVTVVTPAGDMMRPYAAKGRFDAMNSMRR